MVENILTEHRYIDISDLEHDPKLAEALGNTILAWSRVEGALAFCLSHVTQLDLNTGRRGFGTPTQS